MGGTDDQRQVALDCACANQLARLLDHPKKSIRKDAVWCFSNILAGTHPQIQMVLDQGVLPQLITLLSTADYDIKKELMLCFSNLAEAGKPEQVQAAVEAGCLQPLVEIITFPDFAPRVLGGLRSILDKGGQLQQQAGLPHNPFVQVLKDCNGDTVLSEVAAGEGAQ